MLNDSFHYGHLSECQASASTAQFAGRSVRKIIICPLGSFSGLVERDLRDILYKEHITAHLRIYALGICKG